MVWLDPKKRSFWAFIIFCVIALIIYFFTNLSRIIVIDIMIFAFMFLIFYFISDYIDIRIADFLLVIFSLISLFIMNKFNNSLIGFKVNVKSWERYIESIAVENCQNKCIVKDQTLYDSNNNSIYSWHYLGYNYYGYVESDNKDISYHISDDNRCAIKELGKKLVVSEKCITNE